MAEFYVTQERAMAPEISGKWPKVIPKPDNPNGRLVKVEGIQEMLDGVRKMIDNDQSVDEWWCGLGMVLDGYKKAKG